MNKAKLTNVQIDKIIQLQAVSLDSGKVLWTVDGKDLRPIKEEDIYANVDEETLSN